jgi:Cu+-exporting ATPase
VIAVNGLSELELLRLAAAAEVGSEHPLGAAIVNRARELGLSLSDAQGFQSIAGQGVRATIEGRQVVLGNALLMQASGIHLNGLVERASELARSGATPMYVGVSGQTVGLIGVADTLKSESPEAVEELKALGLNVWMLTGDSRATAEAIAREVGIEHVLAEVLPEQKSDKIRELQAQGHVVAMVGDGINDAPALALADLGIAIGTGTDVAMAASDITLVGGDLRTIVTAISLSRRTVSTIKQGLFWAFAYNVLLVPVAIGVLFPFFHVLLSPVLAAAAMAMSSVSVVTNALRLRSFKRPSSAAEILHPSPASQVREYAYLVAIGAVALLIGGVGLQLTGSQSAMAGGPSMAATTQLRQADRTIQIATTDQLRFDPSAVTVHQGETIAFVVSNPTSVAHEFVVGTDEVQQAHEQQITMSSSMVDDFAFALDLPPGVTRTLLYTFDQPGTLLFGCHVAGHYQAGMLGTITVTPT